LSKNGLQPRFEEPCTRLWAQDAGSSAINDPRSAISNQQSAISNQQSAISNPQSAISMLSSVDLRTFLLDIVRDVFPGEYHLFRLQYDTLLADALAGRPKPVWENLYESTDGDFRSPAILTSFNSIALLRGTVAVLNAARGEKKRASGHKVLLEWRTALVKEGLPSEDAETICSRFGSRYLEHTAVLLPGARHGGAESPQRLLSKATKRRWRTTAYERTQHSFGLRWSNLVHLAVLVFVVLWVLTKHRFGIDSFMFWSYFALFAIVVYRIADHLFTRASVRKHFRDDAVLAAWEFREDERAGIAAALRERALPDRGTFWYRTLMRSEPVVTISKRSVMFGDMVLCDGRGIALPVSIAYQKDKGCFEISLRWMPLRGLLPWKWKMPLLDCLLLPAPAGYEGESFRLQIPSTT
jgi:hypothetical protein